MAFGKAKNGESMYIEYYEVAHYLVFWKSKQIICLLEGWARQKTASKCNQISFITQMAQLIFGGLNINIKQCRTFTSMQLENCFHFFTSKLFLPLKDKIFKIAIFLQFPNTNFLRPHCIAKTGLKDKSTTTQGSIQ